ncbi:MAG: neutral zinc metallopeptidase [Bauldia sp.]
MRWIGRRQSDNIEDRRADGGGLGGGMGGPRMPMGFPTRRAGTGGLGIGAIIVILVVAWVAGINPLTLLGGLGGLDGGGGGPVVIGEDSGGQTTGGQTTGGQTAGQQGTPADEGGKFVSAVLADTEDTWRDIFKKGGATYQDPTLVLFRSGTESACGAASTSSGPFYCPNDRKVYIDLAFYQELRDRFKAPGDFAQAYVIAHEIGHHVQNLLGDLGQVEKMKQGVDEAKRNQARLPVTALVDQFYADVVASGGCRWDTSSLIRRLR